MLTLKTLCAEKVIHTVVTFDDIGNVPDSVKEQLLIKLFDQMQTAVPDYDLMSLGLKLHEWKEKALANDMTLHDWALLAFGLRVKGRRINWKWYEDTMLLDCMLCTGRLLLNSSRTRTKI